MNTINTKRVYQAPDPSDGVRILVDRLWPRGLAKARLAYDLWAKNIAPSTLLRQWYHQDMDGRWSAFQHRYVEELNHDPYTQTFLDQISSYDHVTLLYAARDTTHNHAEVLKTYLEQLLVGDK